LPHEKIYTKVFCLLVVVLAKFRDENSQEARKMGLEMKVKRAVLGKLALRYQGGSRRVKTEDKNFLFGWAGLMSVHVPIFPRPHFALRCASLPFLPTMPWWTASSTTSS
jgi:hypothetical protein